MNAHETGYKVIDLHGESVWRLRNALSDRAGSLEAFNPPNLTEKHLELAKLLHGLPEWKSIVTENIEQLQEVIGGSLKRQRKPYLRIARPGRTEDQVGIHRDTHYGATSDEWVLWIPLTPAIDGAELGVLPGSHLQSDEAYPWKQIKHPDVERLSNKHWLGFMYAPKKMGRDVEDQCEPIPCKLGQAILFNCACVHGQNINASPGTRFSVDMRLVRSDAQLTPHGIHGEVYEEIT